MHSGLVSRFYADIAQLAEQPPGKRQVKGSSPFIGSRLVSLVDEPLAGVFVRCEDLMLSAVDAVHG